MEEIGKETGHRGSVSMPSLDATDDFPAGSTESAATDSVFSSAEIAASEIALDSLSQTASEENSFLNSEILAGEALKDDLDESLEGNKSQESIEGDSAEDLIAAEASEALINSSTEGLDESQGDEDPSIAIDQFIKKIADEQLSSKRIEERQEEEEIQEKDQPMALETDLDDTPPIEATEEDKQEDAIKNANTSDDIKKQTEESDLMDIEEVDDAKAEAQQKALEEVVAEAVEESEDDEHMPESIEEIQKEINKIPVKKIVSKNSKNEKEEVNNGICEMDEDIEEILGGVSDEKKVGNILKIALEKEQKLPTAKDSADVAKNPALIEQSKVELSKLDILICGDCHNPFYFTQEFIEHKKGKCPKVSSMINNTSEGENQQQIWGFCLWKSKYLAENEKKSSNKSNWFIYQSWCNMPLAERTPWIAAGISIQFASKLANSKVMEMRPAKTAKQSFVQKITNPPPPPEFIDSNKENSSIFSIDSTGNIVKKGLTPAKAVKLNDVRITPAPKIAPASSSETMTNSALRSGKIGAKKEEFVVEKIMAKRFNPRRKTWEYNIKWENFGHDSNTWEPMNNLSHCKKLLEQFEEQLKRMKEEKAKSTTVSPKTRGRPAKEPKLGNLTSFSPPKISNIVGGVTEDYGSPSTNRPQRHCKQKALNQVRQWCGSNSDDDDDDVGLKRKYNLDDDSDDDFEDKRIKLEMETEDSDEAPAKSKIQIKKVSSTPRPMAPAKTVKNGNKSQPPQQVVPSNILIPDANGVVRINQKQLPSLKSGVYIMSKTAGIIKLDSNTSKMATSGGQTVVKVLPKVGQSHIKVVSKDGKKEIGGQATGMATPIKITQATAVKTSTSTPRFTPKLRQEPKKVVSPNVQAKMFLKKIEELNSKKPAEEEDSDDGLEPLPFPAPDEPIPPLEEEEKNEDFVLDPETGKIAGIEYVDKPVVIKKEPQVEPATTTELENIVKIAAADLSDDDFDGGNDSDDSLLQIKEEPAKAAPKTDTVERTVVDTSTRGIRKIIKYTVSKPSTPTVLNKNVGQCQVTAKPKPIARPQAQGVRPPQKIINQMVTQPRINQQPQIKTVFRQANESPRPSTNVVRKSVGAPMQINRPRNSFGSKLLPSPLPPTRTYSAMGGIRQANRVQVDGNKGVAGSPAVRRVGNAIVRASPSGNVVRQQSPQQQQQQQLTQRPQVTRIVQRAVSPQKKPVAQQQQQMLGTVKQIQNKPMTTPVKSKTVINMPSLMEEDSPLSPPPKPQPKPTPQRVQAKPSPATQPARPAVAQQKPAPAPIVKQEAPVLKIEEAAVDETSQPEVLDTAVEQEDWSSFTMNDGENPIFVTGDDGTLYQVAGQNEEGQTILLTQGPDGQQQCLLVSNEIGEMIGDEEPQPSTSTANVIPEAAEVAMEEVMDVDQSLETPLEFKTDSLDPMNDQVVAQVVQADPLSPGGTHKVVVMLPDGSFMLTKVTPEEYANLEISG